MYERMLNKILLPKIHRMLKRDGHFAVLFMAWLPG